jgi:hypothetical protein
VESDCCGTRSTIRACPPTRGASRATRWRCSTKARALANPVELAIASDDPTPIAAALRARPRDRQPDELLVALLRQDRRPATPAARTSRAGFARGVPCSPLWGAIEAHHHYRDTRTREAIATGVDLARAGRRNDASSSAMSRATPGSSKAGDRAPSRPGDPLAFEAQVRWVHARLTQHRPDRGPGRFKIGRLRQLRKKALSTCRPTSTQATSTS